MDNFVSKIAYRFYRLIFKEEPPATVKVFIENLWYVAIGYGICAIFIFLFQVVAGRFLGPSEYGKYALVQSIAVFLSIPMNLGISTALIKYNAESEEKVRQGEIIFISCSTSIALSCLFLLIFFVFSSWLSKIFGVSAVIFYLAIIYAFVGNFYITITSIFRSLHKNKAYSFFQGAYGLLMFLSIALFLFGKHSSFTSAVFATYISYCVVSFFAIVSLKKHFSITFSLSWFKRIMVYGLYATIGATSFAFLSSFNLLIINKYLTVSNAGIYNAYYTSSIVVLSMFLSIFITVFFPMASKYQRKEMIIKKINKALPFLFALGIPVFYIVGFIFLGFYGKKYPINLFLMLEFIITGIVIVSYGFYDWLFASEGISGIKTSALMIVAVAILNISLVTFLIRSAGLYGAIGSLGFSYFVGLSGFMIFSRKFITKSKR